MTNPPDLHLLTKAIYDRLVAYAPLTTDLPTYGTPPVPAIFSGFIVPPDAPLPRVVIAAPHVDESQDDTSTLIREQHRDIFVYVSRGKTMASENPADRIAENARTALHNFTLSLSGWWNIIGIASGPVEAPTDETLIGRVFTVRYMFSEN